jgi:glycosyltransferase involved in cell wall biosynthesis
MGLISVIIPSRNCDYLARTIQDLFEKAKGKIEVIALLDGNWPNPIPKDNPNLIIVHKGSVGGMRDSINRGVSIAHGDWIMKSDDHCMFSEGFDVTLQDACDRETLAVPSRYSLDVEKWERKDRPPVQYNFLTWPYANDEQFGTGFHGKKWTDGNLGMKSYYGPENRFKDKPIDGVVVQDVAFGWKVCRRKRCVVCPLA